MSSAGPATGAGTVDAAAISFFIEHPDCVLFCRDGRRRPLGYPMRITSLDGGVIHFTTYAKSAKVAHVKADPRILVISYRSDAEDAVTWATASGRASIWSPTQQDLGWIFSGNGDGRVPSGMSSHVSQRLLEGKRVMLSMPVDQAAVRSSRVVLP